MRLIDISYYAKTANRSRGSESGFTTMEAMVAIGILAIALLPLYEFQSAITDGAIRLEAQNERRSAARIAETYLKAAQPASLSAGEHDMGAFTVTWDTEDLRASMPVLNGSGLSGRFNARLVRISYQIESPRFSSFEGELIRLTWVETSELFAP